MKLHTNKFIGLFVFYCYSGFGAVACLVVVEMWWGMLLLEEDIGDIAAY